MGKGWVSVEGTSLQAGGFKFARRQEESTIGHPVRLAEKPSNWMRRTVHISGKIEPFFGTLDENLRLLEDSLHVRTHLNDTRLTVEGDQESVDQAVKIIRAWAGAVVRKEERHAEECEPAAVHGRD
jgi:phosphate starvation-inducible protein PhoH